MTAPYPHPRLKGVDKGLMVTIAAVLTYAAFFSYYMVMKHRAFMTYMLDLGIYAQNFWLVAHGEAAPIHNSLLVYPLSFLYSLIPSPEFLLVLKSFTIPMAAIPLYLLARRVAGKGAALGLVSLFLLYPPLHGASQFDFHLEDFLPLLLLTLAYFYEARSVWFFLATLAVTLASFEYAPVLTLFYGIWLLLRNMRTKISWKRASISIMGRTGLRLSLLTVGLSVAALLIYMAITPSLLTFTASPNPKGWVGLQEAAEYVSLLYGPLAFLPLTSPSQIATIPWLFYAFRAGGEALAIYNQFPLLVTPFIFLGAFDVFRRLSLSARQAALLLAIMGVATSVYFSTSDPVFAKPYAAHTPRWPVPSQKDAMLEEMIKLIPPDASVLTQNNIAPHLVNRKELYVTLTNPDVKPQFVLIDKSHFSFDEPNIRPSPAQLLPMLMEKGQYGIRALCGPIVLYQLNYEGEPVIFKGC